MELKKRKFYKFSNPQDIEVEDLENCDYMVTETLMTKQEAEEKYPLTSNLKQ